MRVAVWAIAAFSALGGCTAAPERAPGIGVAEIGPPVADDPTLPARFHKPLSVEVLEPPLFDEAVLVYVNRMRAQAGRRPLHRDGALAQAAQTHAINMAHLRTHSHRLPIDGESRLSQRMSRRGVNFRVAGENIGMEKLYRLAGRPIAIQTSGCRFTYADTREAVPLHTYATLAQAAVARWMASPNHRASILRGDFQRMGSGLGIDPSAPGCGDVYLVQNFAG